jgi:heptaprenyl diphosphate synthase
MGLAGALSSALVMGLAASFRPGKTSNVFVSTLGAITHSTAQIAVAAMLLRHAGIWGYWPVLTAISAVTGFFIGVVSDKSLPLAKRWNLN